ncbi:cytochrome P450 [Pilatotrama ljubarskyi]|nr:cytochrome P450 [Pilatotrama ljubarskyi]
MVHSLLQAVFVCASTWLVWIIVQTLVVRSPLDNIPGPSWSSFIYGNLKDLIALDSWPFHDLLVENFPGIVRLRGPLGARILYVTDPAALHQILVKDQYIYEEARFFSMTHELVFGKGLLATLGDHHKKQRKMLNPVFSLKHMRHMSPIVYDVGRLLVQAIGVRVQEGPAELDMATWAGRTALEIIGQAGLGYSFDPLVGDEPAEYATALKSFGLAIGHAGLPRRMLPYLPTIRFAGIGRAMLRLFPHDGVRELVKFSDISWARATAIYTAKKRALEEGDEAVSRQIGGGKDIMSILLKANVETQGENRLDEEELIGQISTLIMAAVDTTSNALSITLTCLAERPEVQEKLRAEIIQAGADKDIDFDTLMSLPYLEAVCRETLRVYAPLTQVFREARKDVVLPLSEPIKGLDGSMIHEILVPKNTTIVAGLMNCNRNKALWGEDAYEWKPERWLAPLPATVTDAKIPGVYSNLMTFLAGGRACIGFKFSQLEMKVILSLLLAKFTFELSDKPIVWNLSGVRYPSVGRTGETASLPMRVGLYKHDE